MENHSVVEKLFKLKSKDLNTNPVCQLPESLGISPSENLLPINCK